MATRKRVSGVFTNFAARAERSRRDVFTKFRKPIIIWREGGGGDNLGSTASWLFGILAAFLLISGVLRLALAGYRRRVSTRAAPWWAVAALDLGLGVVVLLFLVLRAPWLRAGALLAVLALVTLVLIRYRRT